MTTVFQQAIQLIALALGFGFLREFAAIAAFEPVQDLIWKLLMSLAFVYMATRVPSMLGNSGTFDSWLSMLYFGMNLPRLDGAVRQDHRAAGGRRGGRAGGHGGWRGCGQRGPVGGGERPELCGVYGDPIGRRRRWRPVPQERRRVTTTPTERGRGPRPSDNQDEGGGAMCR